MKKKMESDTGSNNIRSRRGDEFGIEKFAMLMMRSEERYMAEEIELPNQEKFRTLREKRKLQYLGILEVDTNKQMEMKEKKIRVSS